MGGYEQEEASRAGQIHRWSVLFGRRVSIGRRSGVSHSAPNLPTPQRCARQDPRKHERRMTSARRERVDRGVDLALRPCQVVVLQRLKDAGADVVAGGATLRSRLRHDRSSLLATFRALSCPRRPALYLGGPAWAATLLCPYRFGYEFRCGQVTWRVAFASAKADSDGPSAALDSRVLAADSEGSMPTNLVVGSSALRRARRYSSRRHGRPASVTIAISSCGIPVTATHASSAKAFACAGGRLATNGARCAMPSRQLTTSRSVIVGAMVTSRASASTRPD